MDVLIRRLLGGMHAAARGWNKLYKDLSLFKTETLYFSVDPNKFRQTGRSK